MRTGEATLSPPAQASPRWSCGHRSSSQSLPRVPGAAQPAVVSRSVCCSSNHGSEISSWDEVKIVKFGCTEQTVSKRKHSEIIYILIFKFTFYFNIRSRLGRHTRGEKRRVRNALKGPIPGNNLFLLMS